MRKVSIIVPVYNVECYLEQCLESALAQTMREIEIICINDGSTDGSLPILKRIAHRDSRVRIVDKPNSGYGKAMNIGIDLARGKYLFFLESDDFILPELCETLYELCEKHALDMIKTDYYEFKTLGDRVCARYKKASGADTYHHVIDCQKNRVVFRSAMYTWSCMYNREFINKYQIRHQETPGASYQDNGFWFQTLMYCRRIYLLDQAFYLYRQDNPNSSIHSKEKVYAFSEEYAFIRKKIENYPGDRDILLRICAYFNLTHNMTSLTRVDKKYTEELLQLILHDFLVYRKKEAWNIRELDAEFMKKLMLCLTEPEKLKARIWKYIDWNSNRLSLLAQYDTYIIYGAGVFAEKLLFELEECKIWNKKILCGVTAVKNKGETLNGMEIQPIQDLMQYKDTALVIICAKKDTENYKQMSSNLRRWGVKNVIYSQELIANDLWPFL